MALSALLRIPFLRRRCKGPLVVFIILVTGGVFLLNARSAITGKIIFSNLDGNGKVNTSKVRSGIASNIFSLYSHVGKQPPLSSMFVRGLENGGKRFCNGSFTGYGYETAILHNVILDNSLAIGQKGGEDFKKFWNQTEDKEFFKFKPGFMRMDCKEKIPYVFDLDKHNHNNFWMNAMNRTSPEDLKLCQKDGIKNYYIAITRYEYVNLYHTMTDYYNAFLVMRFFNLTGKDTNILIVDGHPWGGLDPVWSVAFNSTARLGQLPTRTCFKNLIFGIQGYNSLMFRALNRKSIKNIPLTDEFREFFLSRYGIPERPRRNCARLSILFIWRRPYYNHPRNPRGDVWRKVNNEKEVVDSVLKAFPNITVKEMQADTLDMKAQLEHINQADIFIGMHGSGLSHSMFLPRGAALIEMKPAYVSRGGFHHFELIAGWRGLIYKHWGNRDWKLEAPDHYTHVPPEALIKLIGECIQEMCGS